MGKPKKKMSTTCKVFLVIDLLSYVGIVCWMAPDLGFGPSTIWGGLWFLFWLAVILGVEIDIPIDTFDSSYSSSYSDALEPDTEGASDWSDFMDMTKDYYGMHGEFDRYDESRRVSEDIQQMHNCSPDSELTDHYYWDDVLDAETDGYLDD